MISKLESRRFTFDDENMAFGPMTSHEYDLKMTPRDGVCKSIARRVGANVTLSDDSISSDGHDTLRAVWHDTEGGFHEATVHAVMCCRRCQR